MKSKSLKKSTDKDIKTDFTQVGHKPIFSMEDVNSISIIESLDEAKQFALNIVNASSALKSTKDKTINIINSAKNNTQLITSITNLILSHSGLNVLK